MGAAVSTYSNGHQGGATAPGQFASVVTDSEGQYLFGNSGSINLDYGVTKPGIFSLVGGPLNPNPNQTVSGITCDANHIGWSTVSDSTSVSAEGQTCTGSSSHVAALFCDGTTKHCF